MLLGRVDLPVNKVFAKKLIIRLAINDLTVLVRYNIERRGLYHDQLVFKYDRIFGYWLRYAALHQEPVVVGIVAQFQGVKNVAFVKIHLQQLAYVSECVVKIFTSNTIS